MSEVSKALVIGVLDLIPIILAIATTENIDNGQMDNNWKTVNPVNIKDIEITVS